MNSKQIVETDLPQIIKMLELENKLSLAHVIETAIEIIAQQKSYTEASLTNIMSTLAANPNCSQKELFECCASAFSVAEKALKASRNI
jgi:hypothetical protein